MKPAKINPTLKDFIPVGLFFSTIAFSALMVGSAVIHYRFHIESLTLVEAESFSQSSAHSHQSCVTTKARDHLAMESHSETYNPLTRARLRQFETDCANEIKPEDITDQLRSMDTETQECVRSEARSFLIHKPNSLITNEQFQGIKTSCANKQQSKRTNQAQMKALEGP